MPSFTVPSQKIAPGTLPGPRITPEHVAPMSGIRAANAAIQKTSNAYLQQVNREAEEDQYSQVNEVYNAAERQLGDMLYKGPDALYNREGGMAKSIYVDGDARVTEIHDTHRDMLQTEGQKREFDRRFGSRRVGVMQGLGRQQETQRRVWRENTRTESDYTMRETAFKGVNDPNIMDQMTAASETRRQADLVAGIPKDQVDREHGERVSQYHYERFIQLAYSDPVAALDFYNKESTQAALISVDHEALWEKADYAMKDATMNEVRSAYKEGEKKYKGGGLPAARAKAKEISERRLLGDRSSIKTKNGYVIDVDKAVRQGGSDGNVTSNLIWAMMKQESGFNDEAESPVGAQGVMQIMPTTLVAEKKKYGLDPWDPYDAVVLGTMHLEKSFQLFGTDDVRHALAGYNAGDGAVIEAREKAGSDEYEAYMHYLPKETRNYVASIMKTLEGEPLPKSKQAMVDGAAAAEVSRSDSIDKAQNTQPNDPGQQRAYAAALSELQGDPNFPSMKNNEIVERYEGILNPKLIQNLISARDVPKQDARYSEAMTHAKTILQREGMIQSKPGDPTDMKHKLKYDQFIAEFDRELRTMLAAKSNMPVGREEVQAMTEKLFVDLEFRRVETFAGFDFLNPDTVVKMDYWELRRNGIPEGLDFTKTEDEEKLAKSQYAAQGINDPTDLEVLEQIIYNRTPKR